MNSEYFLGVFVLMMVLAVWIAWDAYRDYKGYYDESRKSNLERFFRALIKPATRLLSIKRLDNPEGIMQIYLLS